MVTPALIRELYNASNASGIGAPTQAVYEMVAADVRFSQSDLGTFQQRFGLPLQAVSSLVIDGQRLTSASPYYPYYKAYIDASRMECLAANLPCAEPNLDVQYLMGITEGAVPTEYMGYMSLNPASIVGGIRQEVLEQGDAACARLDGCDFELVLNNSLASGSGFDITLMSWAVAMANDPSPPKVISFSYGHDEADLARTTMDIFNVEAMKLGVQVPRRSAGHPMKPRARLHARSQRWPR